MRIQVLIATMNQSSHDLLNKMNIRTAVVVGNQCEKNEIEEFKYKGNPVKWLSFHERGVGLNRNNCLMRAEAEVVAFADDDMEYLNNYEDLITQAYLAYPDADGILFNVKRTYKSSGDIVKPQRVRWYNCMRYGAVQFTMKLSKLRINGIYFNQCFGGGTEHSSGEDSLFLAECIKKRLKIYAIPVEIGILNYTRESTWFKGYNKKYFADKGIFYKALSPKIWKLLCLQDAVRHRRLYKIHWKKAYQCMLSCE